jgi:hypothetical protein
VIRPATRVISARPRVGAVELLEAMRIQHIATQPVEHSRGKGRMAATALAGNRYARPHTPPSRVEEVD